MLRGTNLLLLIVFTFTMLYLIMGYIPITLDEIDLDCVDFHIIFDKLFIIKMSFDLLKYII